MDQTSQQSLQLNIGTKHSEISSLEQQLTEANTELNKLQLALQTELEQGADADSNLISDIQNEISSRGEDIQTLEGQLSNSNEELNSL